MILLVGDNDREIGGVCGQIRGCLIVVQVARNGKREKPENGVARRPPHLPKKRREQQTYYSSSSRSRRAR